MQQVLDGPFRPLQELGYLADRESLDIVELIQMALESWQVFQKGSEF